MSISPKDLEKVSYAELEAALAAKKQGEVDSLKEKIKEARGVVISLEGQLEKLTGKSSSIRSPRGSVRESILKALADKALTLDELRQATGIEQLSPTLNNLKTTKLITQVEKRGAYSLTKK